MFIKDIVCENKYIVTKGSSCGSFQLGDIIGKWEDGKVWCRQAGGWLEADEFEEFLLKEGKNVTVEIYESKLDLLEKQRDKLNKEIERLQNGE